VENKPLFYVEGRPVFKGNILFHSDINKTGRRVTAEFDANGTKHPYAEVTVRTDNGASQL
jgi:hypothetical protein